MAFKDLQRGVLEEFSDVSGAEARVTEAEGITASHQKAKAKAWKKTAKNNQAFAAKLTRRRVYVLPVDSVVSCRLCRGDYTSSASLHSHFHAFHPAEALTSGRSNNSRPARIAAAERLVASLEAKLTSARARLAALK